MGRPDTGKRRERTGSAIGLAMSLFFTPAVLRDPAVGINGRSLCRFADPRGAKAPPGQAGAAVSASPAPAAGQGREDRTAPSFSAGASHTQQQAFVPMEGDFRSAVAALFAPVQNPPSAKRDASTQAQAPSKAAREKKAPFISSSRGEPKVDARLPRPSPAPAARSGSQAPARTPETRIAQKGPEARFKRPGPKNSPAPGSSAKSARAGTHPGSDGHPARDREPGPGWLDALRRQPRRRPPLPPQRFAPPTLKSWLGKSIQPPRGKLTPPGFADFKRMIPAALPDGRPLEAKAPPPSILEVIAPPEAKAPRGDHAPHWHPDPNGLYYHADEAWGKAQDGYWSWMIRHESRWWTLAQRAQRMVWHAEHWWWRTQDGWFMLHDGQPWAWRYFSDWKREGFIHPASGTRIAYSEDGLRVALVTPGQAWIVFDCRTGEELARGAQTPGWKPAGETGRILADPFQTGHEPVTSTEQNSLDR